MNKLQLFNRSNYLIAICNLLEKLQNVDYIKLCFMTFVFIENKPINNTNDFFELIGDNLRIKKKSFEIICECISLLEKTNIICFFDKRAALNKNVCLNSISNDQQNYFNVFRQINNMSINSFIRMVSQYV